MGRAAAVMLATSVTACGRGGFTPSDAHDRDAPIPCVAGTDEIRTLGEHGYTVPSNCIVVMRLFGAGGGNGYLSSGGAGGRAELVYDTGAGTELVLHVGEAGWSSLEVGDPLGVGGHPGGGDAGGTFAGGGGGYTSVTSAGAWIAIAAGGGGGGDGGAGGAAGQPGLAPALGTSSPDPCGQGGGGGTHTAGGAGGIGTAPGADGQAGTALTGGRGSTAPDPGGGGGGGVFGGGGGGGEATSTSFAQGGGGGGGASAVRMIAGVIDASTGDGGAAATLNGWIEIEWRPPP